MIGPGRQEAPCKQKEVQLLSSPHVPGWGTATRGNSLRAHILILQKRLREGENVATTITVKQS